MPSWDPQQITLSFKGYEISGFMDGTFITAARAEDTWSISVGAQGDVVRVLNRNTSGTIVVTLQQTSMSNGILSQILAEDEQFYTGIGDVQIKDLRGNTLIHGEEAWVMKPADAGFGKELEAREWTLLVSKLDMKIEGNE